jgi:DNA polymerase-3 subunit gamma/tau
MAMQALYLKWRPLDFDGVVGQEHITYTLRNALIGGRVGHAYLFSGPRGTGKTSMARLLAKAVNCLAEDLAERPCNQCQHCVAVNEGRFLDLIEIDAASHTGVDDVRELRDRVAFSPNEGQYKVYIIDEVHRFSGAAFDALLKTIEEPPKRTIFVLATTEIHKVPQTIKSRCQRFDFRRLSLQEIISRLHLILDHSGIEAEDPALELVARHATGSLRDAISVLDQLIPEPGQVLTLDLAQAILGAADQHMVLDLTAALIEGDTARGLVIVNQVIEQGIDARQFAGQMVEHLRRMMLVQSGGTALIEAEVMPDVLPLVAEQAQQLPLRALLDAIKHFKEAATDVYSTWQPQLPLELAFVSSAEAMLAHKPEAYGSAQPPRGRRSGTAHSRLADQEATAPEDSNDALISAADVTRRWADVRRIVRQSDQSLEAVLNSKGVVVSGVRGNVVECRVPSKFHHEKIESSSGREIIDKALQQVFGLPLQLRSRVSQGPRAEQDPRAVDLAAEDSVISFAVNELGGSVSSIDDEEE